MQFLARYDLRRGESYGTLTDAYTLRGKMLSHQRGVLIQMSIEWKKYYSLFCVLNRPQ